MTSNPQEGLSAVFCLFLGIGLTAGVIIFLIAMFA